MKLNKKLLKQRLSECHWSADSKVWNLINDKSPDFYIANAKIAIQNAEDSPSSEQANNLLIYAIKLLNMARASNIAANETQLPPLQERSSI